jgi:hypothetical protein
MFAGTGEVRGWMRGRGHLPVQRGVRRARGDVRGRAVRLPRRAEPLRRRVRRHTRADKAHCGGCDSACDGLCQASDCVQACAVASQMCGGGCVDVNTDVLHCGECGEACSSDELCVEGECRNYQKIPGCTMCPCEDACADGEDGEVECCDSVVLGGPVCVQDGCD